MIVKPSPGFRFDSIFEAFFSDTALGKIWRWIGIDWSATTGQQDECCSPSVVNFKTQKINVANRSMAIADGTKFFGASQILGFPPSTTVDSMRSCNKEGSNMAV